MNLVSPKHLLPVGLGLAALVIWGSNAFRFVKGVNQPDEASVLAPVNLSADTDTGRIQTSVYESWSYEPRFRDPFQSWLLPLKAPARKSRPRPKRTKSRLTRPEPPKLKFIGMLQDASGSLAMLEDADREIHFAYRGDLISGVKIVAVDSARLSCSYKGRRFELVLKP